MKTISLLAGVVSTLTLLLIALAAPARADNPYVKIIKQPVRLAFRTFDPRRPPRDMPELTPPEEAVCAGTACDSAPEALKTATALMPW